MRSLSPELRTYAKRAADGMYTVQDRNASLSDPLVLREPRLVLASTVRNLENGMETLPAYARLRSLDPSPNDLMYPSREFRVGRHMFDIPAQEATSYTARVPVLSEDAPASLVVVRDHEAARPVVLVVLERLKGVAVDYRFVRGVEEGPKEIRHRLISCATGKELAEAFLEFTLREDNELKRDDGKVGKLWQQVSQAELR